MAKRKRSSRSPQPQHKKTRQHSQHDRCSRTQIPNPNRRKTSQARVPLVGSMLAAIQAMATALDPRVAFRLPIIASGPADGDWMYGHNWVSLAVLVPHRLWGVIALPLRSLLYVRERPPEPVLTGSVG